MRINLTRWGDNIIVSENIAVHTKTEVCHFRLIHSGTRFQKIAVQSPKTHNWCGRNADTTQHFYAYS